VLGVGANTALEVELTRYCGTWRVPARVTVEYEESTIQRTPTT
jgi:lipocalin